MKAVVSRGGDFFGSGQGSWLDQVMVKDLRQGKFTYPGPLDLPHAWAYLPDMAEAFVQVAAQRGQLPAFEQLHFAGHTVTGQDWADVLQRIAQDEGWIARGGPLRLGRLPWPLLRALGVVAPTFEALGEMRYLWQRPHQLVNERMQALVGPERHTPFSAAVRTALADLGFIKQAEPATAPRATAAAG
jgi:nucleoside-diphosphate-sugar epimerase